MKNKEWAERRAEIRHHLRRSEDVSDGAFRLWDELASGWAWKADATCFPNQKTLSLALNRSVPSIRRLIEQLVALGLVVKKRRGRGNVYSLSTEIPAALVDPYWKNNRSLAVEAKKRKKEESEKTKAPEGSVDTAQIRAVTVQDSDTTPLKSKDQHRSNLSGVIVQHRSNLSGGHRSNLSDVMKQMKDEADEEDEADELKQMRDPSVPAFFPSEEPQSGPSRSALGDEHTATGEKTMPYTEDNELDGLIEDPCPRPRRRRGADRSLVPDAGRDLAKAPFPEAQRGSQSVDHIKFDPGAQPMPIDSVESLVRLLRDEAVEKWGIEAKSVSCEISRKLRGQLRNTILTKYSPRQIQSMIRVLVWDWEVARVRCFPYRPDQFYPDPLALVQYATDLVNRIPSGFEYPSESRGALNTYNDLFIKGLARVDESDPF